MYFILLSWVRWNLASERGANDGVGIARQSGRRRIDCLRQYHGSWMLAGWRWCKVLKVCIQQAGGAALHGSGLWLRHGISQHVENSLLALKHRSPVPWCTTGANYYKNLKNLSKLVARRWVARMSAAHQQSRVKAARQRGPRLSGTASTGFSKKSLSVMLRPIESWISGLTNLLTK